MTKLHAANTADVIYRALRRARWAIGLMAALAGLAGLATSGIAQAQTDAPLTLDVQGKISKTNDAAHQSYHFTEAQLLALPPHSITTSTTWTPRSTFTGPLLADILKAVGAYGTQIEFRTLDDYTYTVPVSDSDRYGVVVAYSMNGQRLKVSDFGPLFLIYPRDAFPDEITGASGDSKFVWQIKALIVK
ncbi:molybdopterin-dependent oxidoreductase [Paraburkholderia sp. GAS333]